MSRLACTLLCAVFLGSSAARAADTGRRGTNTLAAMIWL
jgi:hypothetical protein